MDIPNYTYLKLKMPGPHGIITTSTSFKPAYAYEQANNELASMLAAIKEITKLQKVVPQGTPDALKASSGTFKSTEDMKDVSSTMLTQPSTFALG